MPEPVAPPATVERFEEAARIAEHLAMVLRAAADELQVNADPTQTANVIRFASHHGRRMAVLIEHRLSGLP